MSAADDLLAGMMRSKHGWGEKDFDKLYRGFGFTARMGEKHNVYLHPRFRELRATVSRQRALPAGYAQHAIKCILRLKELGG